MLACREKLSPMSADAQFQLAARYPANLDRCRRCGNPRKLHAADGACGLSLPQRRRRLTRAVTAGSVLAALAAASWLLASSSTGTLGSGAAYGVLVGIILLAGGLALADHRR
jgi:hypothetical protein